MWNRSDFRRLQKSPRPSLKSFSLFAVFVFTGIICFVDLPLSLASLGLVPAIFSRSYLSVLNAVWFYIGIILAWLVQPVFLIVFYLLVITPLSLILRLARARSSPEPGWQASKNTIRFDRMF
jgi:hypothetical protein